MRFVIIKLIPILMIVFGIAILYHLTAKTGGIVDDRVQDGLVNLKSVDANSIISLGGEWHFDNRLITRYSDATKAVTVPQVWDNRKHGQYGSYALRVFPHGNSINSYALYLNRIGSAYRVYINGILRLENGIVGTDKANSTPHRSVKVLTFDSYSPEPIDVVIQVSNFHHHKGGLKSTVLFGPQQKIIRQMLLFQILDILYIGSMMVIAFFYIFIYVYRCTDKEHLYITLTVLMFGLYIAGSGESLITMIMPDLSYEIHLKLMHIALVLPLVFYNRMYTHMFPRQEVRRISQFVETAALLYTCFIIATPAKTFIEYLFIAHGVIIMVIVYRNAGLIYGMLKGNPEAFTVLLGNAAFSVASFVELAYLKQFTTNARVMPIGMLMLAIAYNVVILERYLDKIKALARAEKSVVDTIQKNKIVKAELEIHQSQLKDLKECVTQPGFTSDMARINATLKEIYYFKAENGLSVAYNQTEDEILVVALSLGTIVEMFEKHLTFVRCHRCYAVNPRLIEQIVKTGSDKKALLLRSGIYVPLGPKFQEDLSLFLAPENIHHLKAV